MSLLSLHEAMVKDLTSRIEGTTPMVQTAHGTVAAQRFQEEAQCALNKFMLWQDKIKNEIIDDEKTKLAITVARESLVVAIDAVRPPPPNKWFWPDTSPAK
jgi:hypothetical protein